ncbi:MAG: hypothetical protein AAF591_21710 [Verrucomicrobiota bacterium]
MKFIGKFILSLVLVPLAFASLFQAYEGLMGALRSAGAADVLSQGLASLAVGAFLFAISAKLFLMYVLDRRDHSADLFIE